MHWRLSLSGVVVSVLLIGCGGGSGSNPESPPAVRTIVLQFKAGSSLNYTDPASGVSVVLDASALPKSGPVSVQFSDTWTAEPASPQVKRQTHIAITTDDTVAEASVMVSVQADAAHLPNTQFVAQNSDQTWHTIETTRTAGIATARVPDPAYRSASGRGPKHILHLDLSLVPYTADFSETTVDLVLLGGQGDPAIINGSDSVILVHGMNNSINDLNAMAARFLISKQFRAIYALKYPWARDIKQNAADFAALLSTRLAPGTKVPIIGHSMGGLVVSYAIERLKMSDYVSEFVMVATPRQGSNLAGLTKYCRAIADVNLNDPADTSDHWGNLCDLNTVSMRQMQTDSDFMKGLNGAASYHRNYVPYSLIAGTDHYLGAGGSLVECGEACDGLVTKSSLLDYAYSQNATLGSVMKYAAYYNHSSIIKRSGALDAIQNAVTAAVSKLGPVVTVIPDNNGIATDTGWEVPFTLSNDTSAFDMVIEHLVMQTFDRNGDWRSTQWFTPNLTNGAVFPDVPFDWNYHLGSKTTFSRTLHLRYDTKMHHYADAPYAVRAQTAVFVCTGRLMQTNDPFTIITTCIAKDQNGVGPSSVPRYVSLRKLGGGGSAFSAR